VSKEKVFQPIDQHDQHSRVVTEPRLAKYFRATIKQDASDLHLKANQPAHIRIRGEILPTNTAPLSGPEIEEMVRELLTPKQAGYLEERGSIDIAHDIPGSDRFRINIYRQRGELSLAARRVPATIPDFKALNLPQILADVCDHHQGLVLLAGITGSGKSTTIAAMLEFINQRRRCHIVTVEDPIEYIYVDKKALINQREIGIDVPDFEAALKYLMREDPDVILIGEMRDRETFQAALQASETGHLVFGTVHASSAGQTIARILDLFEAESRNLVRQSLAHNLQAIICQKLLPCINTQIGRVPAVEVLLANPTTRKFIEEGRDGELLEVIHASEEQGMKDFNKSLMELIETEMIDPRVAYAASPNPEELKMRMKGITSSRGGLIGRGA
jgi:twitching motility protein PilT